MLRISPNEISINDSEASSIIYGQSSKFEKSNYFYRAFEDQAPNLFTICNRQQHAMDKSLISHAFSRANIIQHEGSIYDKSLYLMGRLTQTVKDGQIIPLFPAFRCMTLDTISEFAFGKSAGALHLDDYKSAIFEAIDKATHSVHFVSIVYSSKQAKEAVNTASFNTSPSCENYSDGRATIISAPYQMDFWNLQIYPSQGFSRCI